MKIITFATMKGGTGKTTCCYNISCTLAKDSKVLVIDCDPQGNLSSNFRWDVFDENTCTISDLYRNLDISPEDIIQPIDTIENLDLIPSSMYLYGTEVELASKSFRETMLSTYLQMNMGFFAQYDYILMDTGPSMGLINQNAFNATDSIILVTDPDVNGAQGADIFVKLWNTVRDTRASSDDKIAGLIINNMEKTNISKSLMEYINEHERFSDLVFEQTVPHTTRFKECAEQNLPIYLLETKSGDKAKGKAIDSIYNLIEEMKNRGIL